MELRFIADVHISPLTVSDLKSTGYQITRITDYLPATASDDEGVLKELLGLGGEESFCSLKMESIEGGKATRGFLASFLGILRPGPLEGVLRKL